MMKTYEIVVSKENLLFDNGRSLLFSSIRNGKEWLVRFSSAVCRYLEDGIAIRYTADDRFLLRSCERTAGRETLRLTGEELIEYLGGKGHENH